MDLCNINDIKALLARHGFRFSKSMGQNFLIEGWVPRDIAEASGAAPGCGVLEVGPGIGPLTRELSLRAERVVSVELDRSLFPILAETLADRPNAEICPGDILKTDIPALVREKFQGLTPLACANLPYNITSPAITALLEAKCFSAITVMIQREVARRLCAPQGSSEGGSFSLFLQYYMKPELLFDVPPEKFLPAPKVTSAVIRCVRRERPAVDVADESFFFKVMRGGFLLRRKTLANSLSAALPGIPKESIQQAIADMGLPAAVRGEQLTLEDFAALSAALGREADGD